MSLGKPDRSEVGRADGERDVYSNTIVMGRQLEIAVSAPSSHTCNHMLPKHQCLITVSVYTKRKPPPYTRGVNSQSAIQRAVHCAWSSRAVVSIATQRLRLRTDACGLLGRDRSYGRGCDSQMSSYLSVRIEEGRKDDTEAAEAIIDAVASDEIGTARSKRSNDSIGAPTVGVPSVESFRYPSAGGRS